MPHGLAFLRVAEESLAALAVSLALGPGFGPGANQGYKFVPILPKMLGLTNFREALVPILARLARQLALKGVEGIIHAPIELSVAHLAIRTLL